MRNVPYEGTAGERPPACLPWIRRRAGELIEARDLDCALSGFEPDEADGVLACAALAAPHRQGRRSHAVTIMVRRRRRRDGAA
jgi:hypothetical protein